MRPIPFLAALLVLVAMGMPWFTSQHTSEGVVAHAVAVDNGSSPSNRSLSFLDVVKGLYLNEKEIRNYLHLKAKEKSVSELLSIISVPLILLGAVIGLFNGKLGHGVGLAGMILLTVGLVPWGSRGGTLSVGVGYLLAWVGFSVGFVSSALSKK